MLKKTHAYLLLPLSIGLKGGVSSGQRSTPKPPQLDAYMTYFLNFFIAPKMPKLFFFNYRLIFTQRDQQLHIRIER